MKKTGVFIVLFFLLAFVCHSVHAASEILITQKKNDLEKLAVLDLEANYGVEKGFARALSVILRNEIYSYGEYEVMSTADLQAVMTREAMLQAMGCGEGEACLLDFGKKLGTRFMVAGSLDKLGSTYSISLRMLDTKGKDAGLVKRTGASCKCSEDEIIATVQQAAAELMGRETPEMQEIKRVAERKRQIDEQRIAQAKADKEKAVEVARTAEKKKEADQLERQKLAAAEEKKRKAEEEKRVAEQLRLANEKKTAEETRRKLTIEQERLRQEQRNKIAEDWQRRLTLGFIKGDTYTDPVTGMEFIYVPGGCYQMGCAGNADNNKTASVPTWCDFKDIPVWQWPLATIAAIMPVGCAPVEIPSPLEPPSPVKLSSPSYYEMTGCERDEHPLHEVCVDGFLMGKYEVTQGEYKKIIGSNPSYSPKGENYPVEKVAWIDAQSFIANLNGLSGRVFRLPTEAEWEFAARSGGKKEVYSGSNSQDFVAWYSYNSNGSLQHVGAKSPNSLGLYDMSGNVWEWCSDWYNEKYYSSSPRNNPQGPSSGSDRVFRGGSWFNLPKDVRVTKRDRGLPHGRGGNLGFRLVLSESR